MAYRRYAYADQIELDRREGRLAGAELTPGEAAARYSLDSSACAKAFGIVLLADDERSNACVQMAPGARHVVLSRTNAHGSVTASYEWGIPADAPADDAVFLSRLTWFAYPGADRFFTADEAVGTVTMRFDPTGHAVRERVTTHGFRSPEGPEKIGYSDVDVAANWTTIPEFGQWDEFFHPEAAA